jgi:hypothetical protein
VPPRRPSFIAVHPSSERTLEPARRDGSFPEKQESDPARLLVVQRESEISAGAGYRSPRGSRCGRREDVARSKNSSTVVVGCAMPLLRGRRWRTVAVTGLG